MITKQTTSISCLAALGLLSTATVGFSEDQASFSTPEILSVEAGGGALPGGAAAKGKLVRLTKTPMGVRDGRLITVYGDAASDQDVWEPKGKQHKARDLFVRYSDDNGLTWSAPVNVSNTAAHYSANADWDGDGTTQPYYGDSEKPNVFNSGDIVVVSWIDAYVPEAGVTWGTDGVSSVQGVAGYPDIDVYPNLREVPYKAPYVAISYDGGVTFEHGSMQPPIQLTYARRDAKQDVNRGAGARWAVTWQEDPDGLQTGSGEGPGTGASGAKVSKGTDIWYTWVTDLVANPLQLRTNRTPLTNQSEYDTTGTNGFPLNPTGGSGGSSGSGNPDAGSIENHGCSRANMQVVKVGMSFTTVVAYEETKGVPEIEEGKTVQYHSFPFDAPPTSGTADRRYGDLGTKLTPQLVNSRRVRFVAQSPNGVDPAICVFWKQGRTTEGGPSDIMARVSTSLSEAAVAAAPSLNVSTKSPTATSADMMLDSEVNPIEDANAHRAVLRGSTVLLGWCYTWNGPLARYTDIANYNFYARQSVDGGATWSVPINVSRVDDTTVTVREPRLIAPAKTGTEDPNIMIAAWGTETNVYEGIGTPESLDTYFTRTPDQGASWEPVVPLVASSSAGVFETQLRVNDDASEIYAVAMVDDGTQADAVFTVGTTVDIPSTIGMLYCIGDGTAGDCRCGNTSPTDTGAGCANSTGAGGLLLASGSASVAADDLSVSLSGLPSQALALLFVGTDFSAFGATGQLLGNGRLCIGGPLTRSTLFSSDVSGAASQAGGYASEFNAAAGSSFHLQVMYRDVSGPCGFGFNSTNALRITFLP